MRDGRSPVLVHQSIVRDAACLQQRADIFLHRRRPAEIEELAEIEIGLIEIVRIDLAVIYAIDILVAEAAIRPRCIDCFTAGCTELIACATDRIAFNI